MRKSTKKLTPLQQAYKNEISRIQRAVKRAIKRGYVFDEDLLGRTPKRVTKQAIAKLQKTKIRQLYPKAKKITESGKIIPAVEYNKMKKKESARKGAETRKRNQERKKIAEMLGIPPEIYPSEGQPYDYEDRAETQRQQGEDYEEHHETEYNYDYEDFKDEIEPIITSNIILEDGTLVDTETGEIISKPDIPKEQLHDRERMLRGETWDKKEKKWKSAVNEYPKFSTMVISNFREDIAHFPSQAEPMLSTWIDGLIRDRGEDEVASMLEEAKGNGIWIDYSVAYKKDLLLGMISQMMDYLPEVSDQFKNDLLEQFEYDEDWYMPD